MIPEVARLSRRSVVGVAAVGVVSGCSGGGGGPAPRKAVPAPGTAARAQAARDSLGLLGRYDAVIAAHPELAARLAPLRAEVARHAQAFGGTLPLPSAGAAAPASAPPDASSSTASPSATPRPSPHPASAHPASAAASLSSLAAAERALADRRAAALLTAPGDLARLMASVAAAGAGHAVLLAPGTGAA
jgi:hypothetical protein